MQRTGTHETSNPMILVVTFRLLLVSRNSVISQGQRSVKGGKFRAADFLGSEVSGLYSDEGSPEALSLVLG